MRQRQLLVLVGLIVMMACSTDAWSDYAPVMDDGFPATTYPVHLTVAREQSSDSPAYVQSLYFRFCDNTSGGDDVTGTIYLHGDVAVTDVITDRSGLLAGDLTWGIPGAPHGDSSVRGFESHDIDFVDVVGSNTIEFGMHIGGGPDDFRMIIEHTQGGFGPATFDVVLDVGSGLVVGTTEYSGTEHYDIPLAIGSEGDWVFPGPYHIGDDAEPGCDPASPSGPTWTGSFELECVPDRAVLTMEAAHVGWETPVLVNGTEVGSLVGEWGTQTCTDWISSLDVEIASALSVGTNTISVTCGYEPGNYDDIYLRDIEVSADSPCSDYIDFVGDAVYVWGCVDELVLNKGNLDPDQRQWFIDQCVQWGVRTVYLSVGDTGLGDDVRLDQQAWMLTDTSWNGRPELAALIRAAGKAERPIAIHAMIGASCSTTPATAGYYRVHHWIDDWDNSPSHFREALDALLEWNSDPEHAEAKFAGLHLDIEEPRDWDYLDRYATILGEIKDQAWEEGMALSVYTEPWWFSPGHNPSAARAVVREGDVDYVVSLGYADSYEAIWALAESTATHAESCGKDAVIAVATHEFWDEDQTPDRSDTFFEEGRGVMGQELDKLEGAHSSLAGFAYHAWNNSVALSDIVAAVTVPKKARVGHVARFDVDLRKPDRYVRRALLRLEIDAPPVDGVYSFVEDRVVTMQSPWTKKGHVYWDAPTESGTYGVRITAMDYDFNTDDNEFYGSRPAPIPLEEWEGTVVVGGRAGGEDDPEMSFSGQREGDELGAKPLGFYLAPSHPCPARGAATIEYSLPENAAVRVDVYDLRGSLVQTLVDESVPAGTHSIRWVADAPSGVYFCRMTARGLETERGFSETVKILLLR